MPKTTRLEPSRCPWCGTLQDAATGANHDDAPAPGDCTLCIDCGEWSVFDAERRLRTPTPDEFNDIVADPETLRVRATWLAMKRAAKHG